MSILENIGFKKKFHIGISVSPNNFIELVAVDAKTKTVVTYASGNVKYNNAIREIIDYDEFADALETLFEDAGLLPSDCAVTLNIPNVQFGLTAIESAADEPYIKDNIQAEIEDLYVFKRSGNEPLIGYTKFNNMSRTVAFSAVQTKAVRKIIEIFDGLGCELVRIESSYTAFLKTLQYCDRFSKYMRREENVSILLVTANNCASFFVEDGLVTDFFEEPIAVKSFSKEEVYVTISKILTNAIGKNTPQSLLIVSETDEVDPAVLLSKIAFHGEADTVNKGINSNEKFIEVSMDSGIDANMISYMTLEAVGAAVADLDEYPVDINFLPPDRVKKNIITVGEYEVEAANFTVAVIVFAIACAVIVGGILWGLITMQTNTLQEQSNAAQDQIQVFKSNADSIKNKFQGLYPSLKSIVDKNKTTNDVFTALSTDIPENVYVKNFVTNEEGGMLIVGKAKSADTVREFVSSLKAKNNDLHLSKFAVDEENVSITGGASTYVFEIKTQSINISLDPEGENAEGDGKKKDKKVINGNVPIL